MKERNWPRWSSAAEVVSLLAILITLFYLAAQTKQNTDAINANAMQTLFSMTQQKLEFLLANPKIQQLRYKIELSDVEAVQLSLSLISIMRSREHEWLQYRNGIIDRGILDTLHSPIRSILSSVNGRKFWETIGQVEFDGEFTAYVNQMLEGEPIDKKSKFIEIYIGK